MRFSDRLGRRLGSKRRPVVNAASRQRLAAAFPAKCLWCGHRPAEPSDSRGVCGECADIKDKAAEQRA